MDYYRWDVEKNEKLKAERGISFEQVVMHIERADILDVGEWTSVKNLKGEIKRHQTYAQNTLKKDRRVNIRVSSKDFEELQTIAVTDGIPYQTLMSSVLHRFVNGLLVDKRAGRTR